MRVLSSQDGHVKPRFSSVATGHVRLRLKGSDYPTMLENLLNYVLLNILPMHTRTITSTD